MEKLIRAFHDIGPIYILLRPKKRHSADERLKTLLQSRCFSFHTYSDTQMAKIIPIAGNVSEPMLGISATDLELLANTVSIVFHNAATIRFDALLA